MNMKRKKGFTIVELVIVMAIIGILSAILIPTFISLVNSAREAADTQMVRNLNNALATDSAINGKHETAYDAIKAANKSGYSVEKLTPTSLDYDVVWDRTNDRFILVNGDEYVFFDETTTPSDKKYDLWKIYDKVPELEKQVYSIYLAGETTEPVTVKGVGFDAGENTGITEVKYSGSGSDKGVDVAIRTNGSVMTIDAEKDTIHHFGMVNEFVVTAVSTSDCYHEHGHIGKLTKFESGKFVAHDSATFCQTRGEIEKAIGENSMELENGKFDAHNYKNFVCVACENLSSIGESLFKVNENGLLEISNDKYLSETFDITIPSIINGNEVKTIDSHTFQYCDTLRSIELPNTVTTIGANAFGYCKNLETVILPDSLKTIEQNAFGACIKLKEITLPEGITSIGKNAFSSCKNLKSIDMSHCNNLTKIGEQLFNGCSSLEEIKLPETITKIGYMMFNGCASLKSLYLPSSVKTIDLEAFTECENLTEINVDEDNPIFKSKDGNLYNFDETSLIRYTPAKTATSFTVPDTVVTIENNAFDCCYNLISITFSSSSNLQKIMGMAFFECQNLESITLPESLNYIGVSAFDSCTSLTSITLPNSLTTIDQVAFGGCTSLTSIELPEGLTTISANAFGGCTSLTSITLPSSLTTISANAFSGCVGITIYYNGTETQWKEKTNLKLDIKTVNFLKSNETLEDEAQG